MTKIRNVLKLKNFNLIQNSKLKILLQRRIPACRQAGAFGGKIYF